MTRALITGITGQDGSYMAELLLEKGYEVHGLVRPPRGGNLPRVEELRALLGGSADAIQLHEGDLTDADCLSALVAAVRPDEVYNLGAQSHVGESFEHPAYTADVVGMGALRLLEAIRAAGLRARFHQASSSAMFGSATTAVQDESTPFHPRSPYASAKVFAYWLTVNHRESYGLHASTSILFNHESPRRGENFVTRKITLGLAAILSGRENRLVLGDLETERDWGYAPDYVEAMWRIVQHPEPGDFVLATGQSHTVRDFLDVAFGLVGRDWREVVEQDPSLVRAGDVHHLQGDASKARRELAWEPRTPFSELVRLMVISDLEREGLDPGRYLVR